MSQHKRTKFWEARPRYLRDDIESAAPALSASHVAAALERRDVRLTHADRIRDRDDLTVARLELLGLHVQVERAPEYLKRTHWYATKLRELRAMRARLENLESQSTTAEAIRTFEERLAAEREARMEALEADYGEALKARKVEIEQDDAETLMAKRRAKMIARLERTIRECEAILSGEADPDGEYLDLRARNSCQSKLSYSRRRLAALTAPELEPAG